MTDSPAAAGPRLKAERERRALSTEKAADEVLLDAWVIEALEADEYDRVGPPVYIKGHLKRYAEFLGLPADEILAAYQSRSVAPRPAPAAERVRMPSDEPSMINVSWSQLVATAAGLVLLLGLLWWKPWQQRGAASASPPMTVASNAPASAAAPPAPMPVPPKAQASGPPMTSSAVPAAPPLPSARYPIPTQPSSLAHPPSAAAPATAPPAATPAQTTPPESADATAGAGRARLRFSFSADSWVDVHDALGRRAYAGNGRANSVRTIAGVGPMRVYLGFASGVQLEINNRAVAIGPQFVAGDVARFEAGADGVLRRDPHSVATPTAQTRNARPNG